MHFVGHFLVEVGQEKDLQTEEHGRFGMDSETKI
jgi:hypothetical protein